MIWKLVLVVTAIYTAICLSLYLFQSRLVFFPTDDLMATPAAAGLGFEEVVLRAADGAARLNIKSATIGASREEATLLFFHGNAGNISHRLDSLQIFHDLGLDVLIFDYRGYGRSGGKPSERHTYEDAHTAWRYLTETRGIAPERIVLFGRSLGGAVAAWLASRERPAGLIVESTFTSVPELAAQIYPIFPVRLMSRIGYDARAAVAEARCPVLVAHSVDDEIIPFSHAKALHAAANEPKYLLEMRGGHNDGFLVTGAAYRRGLAEFLHVAGVGDGATAAAGGRLPSAPPAGREALPLTPLVP